MRDVTVVVLGKYNDIFEECRKNFERFASSYPKVLVRDGQEIPDPVGWTMVQGVDPFVFSRNVNLGIIAAGKNDVLFCGDDVSLLDEQSVVRLQEVAYSDVSIGILSPRILGYVGNPRQSNPNGHLTYEPTALSFICVYIKRDVIDAIGFMDESFVDYGADDVDYCRRTWLVGYQLAITSDVSVQHGNVTEPTSRTYLRTFDRDPKKKKASNALNRARFLKKWGESL